FIDPSPTSIYTLSLHDALPIFALSGGRLLAVGSNEEVLGLSAGLSRKIDLGGKTVLPGFNDAHSHPCESGVAHLRMVACDMDSRSEEHTSELQSQSNLVCRLLL